MKRQLNDSKLQLNFPESMIPSKFNLRIYFLLFFAGIIKGICYTIVSALLNEILVILESELLSLVVLG